MKFLFIIVLASLACKLIFRRWPWDFLRKPSTRNQALFRARKLLAVSESATRAEIQEAHRRLVAMVHPDRGGTGAQVHEATAARDLLLDELPYEGLK